MKPIDKTYDFVIIGSGLGGLECAYILAEEGHSVVVLEKNHQIGGTLQVFSRDKTIFETGVHYLGSLDEGEILNKFFKYFDLLDKINLRRMDDYGYDVIRFADGTEYRHAQGYDNFIKTLVKDFPEEEEGLIAYCDKIKEICNMFPLYNLRNDDDDGHSALIENGILEINAYEYISSIIKNEKLKNVLAGSNALYGGVKEKTPLFVHALIINSYMTGSYKLVDGGAQLAIQLSKSIRKLGGEIYKRKHVVSANYNEDKTIKEVVLADGQIVKGEKFISNAHPAATINIFGKDKFLKAYTKRIDNLENTASTFIVHLVFEKDTFEYLNYNIYQHNLDDVWEAVKMDKDKWPEGLFICTPPSSKSEKYAEGMSIMAYMNIDEVEQWADSFNTVTVRGVRGETYEEFKRRKEEIIIKEVVKIYPDIRTKIKSVYSSTPLTFRDYIGNYDGSLYGILKDSNNPVKTIINPKTKVKNLFLTGQNIVLHGILGVTIGAFVTCSALMDKKALIKKVEDAQ
jgi:all-trans-retinol 13,14-reductase